MLLFFASFLSALNARQLMPSGNVCNRENTIFNVLSDRRETVIPRQSPNSLPGLNYVLRVARRMSCAVSEHNARQKCQGGRNILKIITPRLGSPTLLFPVLCVTALVCKILLCTCRRKSTDFVHSHPRESVPFGAPAPASPHGAKPALLLLTNFRRWLYMAKVISRISRYFLM